MARSMTLASGRRLGPYEIQSHAGAGGMGEVYKARDTRLDRVVAIKVLPGHLASDADLRERFEREAKAISSLNHPHICALYDVGRQDGIDFLVMEYLDGETLASRLGRGPLPVTEALPIASQIADALEAAHDRGIVHRDLKPANVAITADGNVKLLDFGLAKATAAAGVGHDLSQSPTIMTTTPGMIVGTAAYMSPEQANGKEADRSSDVWAFGCVLFEMLTGRRAFGGDTVSEIIANVLKTEPSWERLPGGTPAGISRLLRRCLRKDQKLRVRDIRDARLELVDVRDAAPDDRVISPRLGRGERLAWASALALLALIAVILGMRALRPTPAAGEVRLEINTPPTRDAALAISPDGLKVVFVARTAGQSRLWLRSLDSQSAQLLPGTERGLSPFWSPDSRSIGFIADTRLKRMDIDGGSVQTLATGIPVALGAAWNGDGTIIFGNNPGGPIFSIPAAGGKPVPVTRVEAPRQRGHSFPQFLPDGRHFLFFVTGIPEASGVYAGQLDRLDAIRLFDADGPAVYAAGDLLFVRGGKLLAQAFDPDRLELRGEPSPVADQVTGRTALAASVAGPIAYRTAPPDSGQRQFVWVDRSGRETDKEVYPDDSALGPALTHDGRRIAVYRYANANMDIWSYETSRRVWERITFGPGDDIYPLWSRDGSSIVSGSVRTTNVVDLYQTFLGGAKIREELLLTSPEPKFPMDWSPDGRYLLYTVLHQTSGFDVWALPLGGGAEERKPFEVVQTDFNEGLAQFSPDGRWIAYESEKSGRYEVYLRPFPGPGSDSLVSTAGGTQVRWNPNGKELFYVAADDRLMALPISFSSDGKTPELGKPTALFATSVGSTGFNMYRQQYVVSPDGQSFVMNSVIAGASASPITVILNRKPRDPN
jgi:serine/threonine protein kinase/Tol biopolymer transport system component